MAFIWQLPYRPPDSAALERMRRHFPKPSEPMPYAWFMGSISFFTGLAETPPEKLNENDLMEPFLEIAAGLTLFPQVDYVTTWKAWFKYLLPYALEIVNSKKDTSWYPPILSEMITALMSVYPQHIVEEYEGFRDDVVYSLGTRIFPQVLSRDDPHPGDASLYNPVFNDIWDFSNTPDMEHPGTHEEFSLPIIFCLKYLRPVEIDSWVKSFVEIESPQWHLAVMTWWLAWDKFLRLAQNWPQDGNIECLLDEETGLLDRVINHYPFASIDDFIAHENRIAFHEALSRYLTRNIFQAWAVDIRSHQTFVYSGGDFPISDALRTSLEQTLQNFEKTFFDSI